MEKILENFVEKAYKKGWNNLAREITRFLPKEAKEHELKIIRDYEENKENLERYISEGKLNEALALAKLLPEKQRLKAEKRIVEKAISKWWLGWAKNIVENFPEPLKKEELELINQKTNELKSNIEEWIEKGWLSWAEHMARFLPELHRTEELEKVIEKYIQEKHFDFAKDVAKDFPEPRRAELLEKIAKEENSLKNL